MCRKESNRIDSFCEFYVTTLVVVVAEEAGKEVEVKNKTKDSEEEDEESSSAESDDSDEETESESDDEGKSLQETAKEKALQRIRVNVSIFFS